MTLRTMGRMRRSSLPMLGALALLGCMPDIPPEADPPEVEVSGGDLPEYEYDAAELEEWEEDRRALDQSEQERDFEERSLERPLTDRRR